MRRTLWSARFHPYSQLRRLYPPKSKRALRSHLNPIMPGWQSGNHRSQPIRSHKRGTWKTRRQTEAARTVMPTLKLSRVRTKAATLQRTRMNPFLLPCLEKATGSARVIMMMRRRLVNASQSFEHAPARANGQTRHCPPSWLCGGDRIKERHTPFGQIVRTFSAFDLPVLRS
jgi:hypothetical protein